ncbi:MAG: HD domain-containing protein [Coriobacteriaceae bacterium]|nr:HD domain-containing protein [Coriobacteriaceae bacterium]MCI7439141.1 HD domain-containing protein [Coriobacteriaceae bacterium]MDD7584509.1 HD domain-containing protein [Coriobacteriaceae bacterium]
MKIDDDRLLHVRGVGERAEELANELLDWQEAKCRAMFMLGYLHDVCYQYSRNQLEHEEIGGELLKQAGYQCWREVYYHGVPEPEYQSGELMILNIADMETSKDGRRISMEERFADIANRYGSDSEQYTKAARLAAKLKS